VLRLAALAVAALSRPGPAAPRALSQRCGWGNWLFPAVAAIGAAVLVW